MLHFLSVLSFFKELTDPCFVFSGARVGKRQAVINMHSSSTREKLSHLQPFRLKSLKIKTRKPGPRPSLSSALYPQGPSDNGSHKTRLSGCPSPTGWRGLQAELPTPALPAPDRPTCAARTCRGWRVKLFAVTPQSSRSTLALKLH